MATEFSRALSLLRQERGVSQRGASKDLGISQALLSHYENGIREPGLAFVIRACDYYHVSADFMLGRTLARDGSMLSTEELLGAEDMDNVLRGSILATLQSKLITGSIGVLFELLGKLGDKETINHSASYLSAAVYQLYRQFYRHAGGNDGYFSLKAKAFDRGIVGADLTIANLHYSHSLEQVNTPFPEVTPQAMADAFPGRSQSLTQVLTNADSRLSKRMEE